MKTLKTILGLLAFSIVFVTCKKDDNPDSEQTPVTFTLEPTHEGWINTSEKVQISFDMGMELSIDSTLKIQVLDYQTDEILFERDRSQVALTDENKNLSFDLPNVIEVSKLYRDLYIIIQPNFIRTQEESVPFEALQNKNSYNLQQRKQLIEPTLLSPPNEDISVDHTQDNVLAWNIASWVDPNINDELEYHLYYGTTNPPVFNQAIVSSSTVPTTSLVMESNTTYYWQLLTKSKTENVTLAESPIWKFTTLGNAITLPVLQTPTNGATNVPANVAAEMAWTLASWNDPNNTAPISYDLHFGENSNPPQYQAIPAGNTTPISSISTTPNTTYYWKIVAKNGGDVLGETPVWSFTTEEQQSLVTPLNLLTPADAATDVENNNGSVLSWSLVEWTDPSNTAPIAYDLYFGTDPNPSPHQFIPPGNTSPASLTTTPNTTYYWKVVAKNGADILGETPVWSFTTATTGGGGTPGATVFVAGGTFSMGSTTGQSDESPVHSVTLSDFSIGKYEVTNAEYATFLNSQGNQTEGGATWLDINDSDCQIELVGSTYQAIAGKSNHPVIEVTWYGAKAYATWVGGRLPTEAEWEYAARGGNQSNGYTYSGSNAVGDVAWYSGNTTGTNPKTEPIGTKTANELGIHDMSGNVWEWCNDWYGSNYYSSSPSTNPTGPTSGSYRVLRGGSWDYIASGCRVANRNGGNPFISNGDSGFRVVF